MESNLNPKVDAIVELSDADWMINRGDTTEKKALFKRNVTRT